MTLISTIDNKTGKWYYKSTVREKYTFRGLFYFYIALK